MLGRWLDEQGLSQRAFAAQIGVHTSSMTDWLKGRWRPTLEAMLAIEQATEGKVPVRMWAAKIDT